MFSLLITIISIALVAALAVATIYYGGAAFTQGKARATAAAVTSQGQQILGAAQIFRATQGRWPDDINELVSANYLRDVPIAPLALAEDTSMLGLAYAASATTWSALQPGVPYYWVHNQVSTAECQQLNLLVRGDNGIFNAAKPSLATQCFGPAANYTVVIGFPDVSNAVAMAQAVAASDASLSVDETGYGYSVPVTVTAPAGGAGGQVSVAPTFGPFILANQQVGNPAFSLSPPTSNSTGDFSYGSSNASVASVSGNVVTILSAGTTTISAVQAGVTGFTSGLTTASLTVAPMPAVAPSIGTFSIAPQTVGNPTFALTAPSSNSPGLFSYASSNSAVATVSGNTVTVVGAGSTTISATQAAAPGFTSSVTSAVMSVAAANVSPTIGSFTVASKVDGSAAFTLSTPTSNSPGAFTFVSSNTAVATISGNVVTIVAPGSTTITASQDAAPGYNSGTKTAVFTVTSKVSPSTSALTIPTQQLYSGTYTITNPTSNSSGAWTYSSNNAATATVSGNIVTFVDDGTATITATQAAAGIYTSKTLTTTLTVTGAAREWLAAYSANSWYGACPGGWRQATAAELLALRAKSGGTSYYGGWNWTSDVNSGYHVIVNMNDGRTTYDYDWVTYARMCTR